MDVNFEPAIKKIKSCDRTQDIEDTHSHYARASTTARRLVIPTPDMEFGFRSMGKKSLRTALQHQINAHRVNTPVAFIVRLRDKNLVEVYQRHRLAAVSWYVRLLSHSTHVDMHTLISNAIDLLDRYVARVLEADMSLFDILKDIQSLRAACLLLSCNMYAVFHSVFPQDMCRVQQWPIMAHSTEKSEGSRKGMSFTDRDVKNQQTLITFTLRGRLFPMCTGNVARVLCKYMILEYMALTRRGDVFGTDPFLVECKNVVATEQLVLRSAVKFYTRRTLNVELLAHEPVRCMAVCCLLAIVRTLNVTPVAQTTQQRSITHLLFDHNCVMSEQEFQDITKLLTTDCVVCRGGFVTRDVESALHRLSVPSCRDCKSKTELSCTTLCF